MGCGEQAKDAARIREFLLEHKPHAVLVGAANSRCKVLKEDLDRLRDHILEHMPQVTFPMTRLCRHRCARARARVCVCVCVCVCVYCYPMLWGNASRHGCVSDTWLSCAAHFYPLLPFPFLFPLHPVRPHFLSPLSMRHPVQQISRHAAGRWD